ncbi:preprotein translocase subunit SecY [Blattabacterium sp. (Cryptocercus punctulatus) str. Cpu]|uniref:preprotein translocase subunit SecY n=1 Tax=Blattabacterium sp. (Cryptocercus punctulatus) str. Cpu TaxID=1075399 RepID=UPI00023872DA|nr:preprotein translocase subunit SecY [Blattabacterium sp. (Cryptocercus punctulatus) str. Cpu]AEU09301.1 preprotein translocase subunit SecY [Blattabacterium sp. (Cryptocercus punctulatus) str. Cpu]
MNNFLIIFHNIWNIRELRKKIIITLSFLLVYRFGAYIPIPGINPLGIVDFMKSMNSGSKGLMQILSSFTGGAFNRASILALGIMPYISASIIIQLMCIVIPYLQKVQRDGESGKRHINFITRWLTVGICLIQAPLYLISLTKKFSPINNSSSSDLFLSNTYLLNINTFYGKILFWTIGIIILTSGTLFTMWLGDKITDEGIGNGISLIIMSGIIVRFPDSIVKEIYNKLNIGNGGMIILFFEFLLWLIVILFCIVIIQSIRKIPIQYVSHYKSLGLSAKLIHKKHQYIPLKMTAAGVMPIIFSQAIMLFPLTFFNYVNNEKIKNFFYLFQDVYGLWYNLAFSILVIIFTFFYTAITIPVNQIADDLKRNGGHIPKIKPGKETVEYIDSILSKITLPGAILLAIIAILPSIVFRIGITQNFSLFYGGTSLLIVVGVMLDLIQQVDIYLLNYYYDDLMMIKNHNNSRYISNNKM